MVLRKAKKKDVNKLMKIVETINPNHSFNWRIKKSLNASFGKDLFKPTYIVLEDNEEIVGFTGFAQSRTNYRIYEFFTTYVHPDNQGKGIGEKLVERTIKEVKLQRRTKEDDIIILLTSLKPGYFKKFGFETLTKLKVNGSHLMFLRV